MCRSPIKILVVDDEEFVRENLKAFFEDEGYEVTSFGKGEDAVNFLKHEHMDLGIIDIGLPGINGDVTIIKSHKIQPEMKFIIYTGSIRYGKIPKELSDIGISKNNIFHKTTMDMNVLSAAIDTMI